MFCALRSVRFVITGSLNGNIHKQQEMKQKPPFNQYTAFTTFRYNFQLPKKPYASLLAYKIFHCSFRQQLDTKWPCPICLQFQLVARPVVNIKCQWPWLTHGLEL